MGDKNKEKDDVNIEGLIYHLNMARENYETHEQMCDRFDEHFDDEIYWTIADRYLKELVRDNCIDFSGMLLYYT